MTGDDYKHLAMCECGQSYDMRNLAEVMKHQHKGLPLDDVMGIKGRLVSKKENSMLMPGMGAESTAIWLASKGWKFNSIKQKWQNPLDSEYHDVNSAVDIVTMEEREEEQYAPITCKDCEPTYIAEPHIGPNSFGKTVCGCHCHREQIKKWS